MGKVIPKLIEFLKHHTALRMWIVKNVYSAARYRYRCIYQRKKRNMHKVVFESYMGRQYACSPKAIYEEMLKDARFKDFEFVWLFTNPDKMQKVLPLQKAVLVRYGSKEAYRHYATAKYVISNSNIKFDIVPFSDQVFVQTWHGTPLKRLRCDIEAEQGNDMNTLAEIHFKNDQDIKRYRYFLSPSRFSTEKFITAFRLRELGKEHILLEEGYPRNDFLFQYQRQDVCRIKTKLGIVDDDRKIVLYAPTFRDNMHNADVGYTYDLNLDFERLRQELSENFILLFRTHYFIASKFDFSGYQDFVIDVTDIDDVNELYIISDILVTDYSSVIFDYANLKRPMLFYMYDLEEYEQSIRGFYIDINELPGKIVRTQEQLTNELKHPVLLPDVKYETFCRKYNSLEDGNASKRVIDKVFGSVI